MFSLVSIHQDSLQVCVAMDGAVSGPEDRQEVAPTVRSGKCDHAVIISRPGGPAQVAVTTSIPISNTST